MALAIHRFEARSSTKMTVYKFHNQVPCPETQLMDKRVKKGVVYVSADRRLLPTNAEKILRDKKAMRSRLLHFSSSLTRNPLRVISRTCSDL